MQGALEKMIQLLRTFPKTPVNGLAVFAGNAAATEGKQDMKAWSVEPPIALNTRIYRCDKHFVTDILEDMLVEHSAYGLVVLDRRDATIALLKGKTIVPLQTTHSEVPGKTKAGGQCLIGSTLIQSGAGEILKIKNSHNPCVVKSMVMNDFSLGNSPITDKWDVKKKEVYTITTKSPRLQIESSKDHVFFVRTNKGVKEVAAEELREGDFLIMPEQIDVKGDFQTIKATQYYNSFIIDQDGRNLLKKKREEKGFLQKKLAEKIGLTQTIISSYELGKRNASREPLQRLCAELGINFYEFLNQYASPYKYSKVTLPVVLDQKFAQFLGYLIGDGCVEKDRISFFEQSKEVALEYKKMFDTYFDLNSSYRFRESKNYHQLRFTSRPLVRLIVSEFPEIKKARDTIIPSKILQSPKEVIASFLRGLFDAEGYISTRKQVALGINNRELAHQIQMVLLRFSIISSLHEYDNKNNKYSDNPRFTVDVTEKKSLTLFQKIIGLTCAIKSEKLLNAIKTKTDKSNVRQILIPGTEVRKTIEKHGSSINHFPKVSHFFYDKRMMSKEAFKHSILDLVENEELYKELSKIYEYSFLPVKISNIVKEQKETEMVDISVGNQNFIANGLLVHNSAQRYARIREGSYKDHFKKIADMMKDQFLPLGNNLKGIILGGPGITVNDFMNKDYVTGDLKKKIIGTKDLSYTGDPGLQELLDKSQDLLAEEEIAQEKKAMEEFFQVFRDNPKKVTYGEVETLKALEMNAVDVLLVSETLEEDTIFDLEEKANAGGARTKIISTETREGVQLKDLGKIAAILRFELE